MASTGVNVARWSALALGVFYGVYHQSSIRSHQRKEDMKRKFHEEESLIAKAKAEYLKKTLPKDRLTPGGGVISDPNDPKFDLEAYLKMAEVSK